MPTEALESVLERAGIDADAAEDWLSSLARIGSQVLPIAGSIVGTAYGGPVGSAIGGAVGSMAGKALGSLGGGGGSAQPAPQPPPPSATPAAAAPIAGGSPAAAQLLQLISRPEVQRALFAMALGPQNGATSTQVGSAQIPQPAIANAIGQLAQQATAEYEASYGDSTGSAYLDAIPGTYDATDPVSRARAVESAFRQEDAVRTRIASARRTSEAYDAYDAYDGLDAYDVYEAYDGHDTAAWSDNDYEQAVLLMDALSDLEA